MKYLLLIFILLMSCNPDDCFDEATCEEHNALIEAMYQDQLSRYDKHDKSNLKRIAVWRENNLIECN